MMQTTALISTLLILLSVNASAFAGNNKNQVNNKISPQVSSSNSKTKTTLRMGFLKEIGDFLGFNGGSYGGDCVMGDESIMSPKSHGTSDTPVQSNLRWDCDYETADRICNYNRHYAERSGYWIGSTSFPQYLKTAAASGMTEITFYDSNTGKPLFVAPKGRSLDDFYKESQVHGWPSFRDSEVVWDNVRVLPNGEAVSLAGTHLGHNLPDATGNRYCINLVSIAGNPKSDEQSS